MLSSRQTLQRNIIRISSFKSALLGNLILDLILVPALAPHKDKVEVTILDERCHVQSFK